jgi:hypothetical protein
MATILLLLCGIPLVLAYIYIWPVALKLARGEKLEEIIMSSSGIDQLVMERLRAPFSCEFVSSRNLGRPDPLGRWRIADANDDAIASCSAQEEGYARLICQALNEHLERRALPPSGILKCVDGTVTLSRTVYTRLLQVIGDEWGPYPTEEEALTRISDDGWFARQLAEDTKESET